MYCTSRKLATSTVVQAWVREAARDGKTDTYTGKRTTPRTTWDAPLAIKILSGLDKGKVIMAKARDISLGGLGLISRVEIPQHVEVEISVGSNARSAKGRIMHSSKALGGFIIGIKFDIPAPSPTRRLAG